MWKSGVFVTADGGIDSTLMMLRACLSAGAAPVAAEGTSTTDVGSARGKREVIRRHAARAAIGALTALAPAADLVVRGAVGSAMSRELAGLCEADARPEVLDALLAEAQRQIEAAAPLFLAVAARALGRRAAGLADRGVLVRAVALGLSFEALGKAVAGDLERWGVLRPFGPPELLRSTSAADLAPLAPRYARLAWMALERGDRSLRGDAP